LRNVSLAVLIYADDILLLAPSLSSLQLLVDLCCKELSTLDMEVNYRKSVCMRIGPRFNVECTQVITSHGHILNWVHQFRYLGVFIESASVLNAISVIARNISIDRLTLYLVELDVMPLPRLL
jgi:hypothetical protein